MTPINTRLLIKLVEGVLHQVNFVALVVVVVVVVVVGFDGLVIDKLKCLTSECCNKVWFV
jgi:hypothetical protein